jgi:hypothetical protein
MVAHGGTATGLAAGLGVGEGLGVGVGEGLGDAVAAGEAGGLLCEAEAAFEQPAMATIAMTAASLIPTGS